MSGDTPPVIDLVGGLIAKLVESANLLFSVNPDRQIAVIGGLAVTCRCKTMVRATGDVDTVTGPGGAAALVRELGADELADALEHHRPSPAGMTVKIEGDFVHLKAKEGHLFVNGIKVDVIDTHELSLSDLEGLEAKQQLFVASHRWALESAESAHLRVSYRSAGGDVTFAHATLPVATPAALVTMKLHSLQDRTQARPEKEASDTEDLYRLLQEHDPTGDVASTIAKAPYGLPALALEAARHLLVEEALLRLRHLRTSGGPSAAAINDADFRLTTEEFTNALEHSI